MSCQQAYGGHGEPREAIRPFSVKNTLNAESPHAG